MISDTIEVKGIIWEDIVNYKKIGTTLMFPHCDFKCDKECGVNVCQNSSLAAAASQTVLMSLFMRRYMENPLTEAIILQGLEPLDDPISIYTVSAALNDFNCQDDLVIYTGYYKEEVDPEFLHNLATYTPGHLIIKWGRYIPNQEKHYDPILGIYLASNNQYGEMIK